ALYDAKRAGRDRVVIADTGAEPAAPATARSGGPDGTVFEVVPQPTVRAPAPTRLEAVTRRAALAATPVSFGHDDRNWLVRGDFEREHIRTSARAMVRTHHGALGMIGLALVASIPWMGWQLMAPAILPVIAYHAAERRIRRVQRPELTLGLAWLSVQVAIFAGALIASPAEPYMLILFVPMMIGVTAVFPSRGILVATVLTLSLLLAGAVGARAELFLAYPGLAIPPVLLIAGFALMSSVAGRSAIEFRTQAIVDPLTGLLTRAALTSRLEELGKQSTLDATTEVSVIAFDIDAFKILNDTYGHAAGDDVLRAVGEATRSQLRALEWGFRLGGDEFMVVVPVGEAQAAQLAGTLRAAIAAIDVDGVGITGSFGVAALRSRERFDFEALSARADVALYEAKRGGRNRVALAPPHLVSVVAMPGAA
ncbi:MAG: diguanylate cyclase, partial [Solirubrobacteraceae bacterium]|nr:diguanylate cyclase [Solirubrobacteraceae bacterium]